MTQRQGGIERRIVIVEDDAVLRSRTGQALEQRGYAVILAGTYAQAIEVVAGHPPPYALVDLKLPDGSGLDVVQAYRAMAPGCRIVVLTGYGSIATALQALQLGAMHYLSKPANVDEILLAFERGPDVSDDPKPKTRPLSLARVEREHIERVLADCGGNISETARVLGLPRRSLQRKLRRPIPDS